MTPRGPIARAPSGFCNLSTEPAPAAPAAHSPADGRPDTRTVHTSGRRGRDTPARAAPVRRRRHRAPGPPRRRCPASPPARPSAEPVRPPRACIRRARRKPEPRRKDRVPAARPPARPGPSLAGRPQPHTPPPSWGVGGCGTPTGGPAARAAGTAPLPAPGPLPGPAGRPWI